MPKGLRRFHHTGDWHFITCSCYRRQKFLDWAQRRDLFLDILEQVRAKYDFVVAGYVVMPEHFHLLIGEPRVAKLSRAMQVLKQRVSLRCRGKK
jgi:putative transposase